MRYRLRTLLIVLALGPPMIAGCVYVGGYFGCSSNEPGFADRFFPSERHADFYEPMVRLEEILTRRDLIVGWSTADEELSAISRP